MECFGDQFVRAQEFCYLIRDVIEHYHIRRQRIESVVNVIIVEPSRRICEEPVRLIHVIRGIVQVRLAS